MFQTFYKKNKEVILYLFFGGLAFIVSIATYVFFDVILSMNELIANVLSWIITVSFAYVTNKIWVFDAPTKTVRELLKQMISFFSGRIATLVIEELILLVFVTWLVFPSVLVKVVAQVIVIIFNYIISKFFVF